MKVLILVVLVCGFALVGFLNAQKRATRVGTSDRFVEIVNQVQHSICAVVAGRSQSEIGVPIGSGFFINGDGYFVTNAHVARDFMTLGSKGLAVGLYFPMFVPGKSTIGGMGASDVSFIDIDDRADIAIGHAVNMRGGKPSFLGMRFDQPVVPGVEVAMTGFPLTEQYPITTTASVASQIERTLYFFVDRPILRGFSGSPVYLRSTGEVVGIAARSVNAPVETQEGPSKEFSAPALGHVLTLGPLRGKLTDLKIAYNEPRTQKIQ